MVMLSKACERYVSKKASEQYLQQNLLFVLTTTCQQNALHVSFLQGTCQQLGQDSAVWKKITGGHAAHVNAHQALVALPLCKGLSFQCWVQRHQVVQLCLYARFWLLKSHKIMITTTTTTVMITTVSLMITTTIMMMILLIIILIITIITIIYRRSR